MVAYFLYTALGKEPPYYGFTHDPYLDTALLAPHGYSRLFIADLPLPIDLVAPIVTDLRKTGSYGFVESPRPFGWIRSLASSFWLPNRRASLGDCPPEVNRWLQHVGRQLRRQGLRYWQSVGTSLIKAEEVSRCHMPADVLDMVTGLLRGRVLSYDELQSLLSQRSLSGPYPLRDLVQALALEGKVEIWPGIESPLLDYYVCRRCGEKLQLEKNDCPLCGRHDCISCPSCRSLGEVRSCRELYHGLICGVFGKNQDFPDLKPQFSFQLTPAQAGAAVELKTSVDKWIGHYVGTEQPIGCSMTPPRKPHVQDHPACLVWAVCGAGKTEIAFEALALALRIGLRVVFAIPRRDVVVELAERAKTAFPEIPITALYGGIHPSGEMGPLVIATTHQLLRFAHYFDLAILDEADAFPYAGSAMLYRAFQGAVKPGGLKVYMTATPEPAMLQVARQGTMELITIPVRHHGYPVPVPELLLDRRHLVPSYPGDRVSPPAETKLNLPSGFWARLQESLQAGNRVFIFVPRVWLVSEMVKALVARLRESDTSRTETPSHVAIFGTHSRDAKRDEKRSAFASNVPAVMVTTSVLERGITVPRADVIVLYAHDSLYDARTLMQMAGRSGRSASYPRGRVHFMTAATTRAIQWAISSLEEINTTAKQRGLLVGDLESCQ